MEETSLTYASKFSGCIVSVAILIPNLHIMLRTPAQWQISNSLLLATVIRIGLVVISYGCKVPAGIFVPSMAIGATFGRMVGIMVKAMNQCVLIQCFLLALS